MIVEESGVYGENHQLWVSRLTNFLAPDPPRVGFESKRLQAPETTQPPSIGGTTNSQLCD